jgi:hypothetical protein
MGDLILNGFDEAVGADGRHGNPDLREDLDSENKTPLKTGNRFSITLGIIDDNKSNTGIERVPSIMVDTTRIPHNPKDLDRQRSHTAAQTPVITSGSRNSDPEASASGTLYDPGQRLLSHITPEGTQTDGLNAMYSASVDGLGQSLLPDFSKPSFAYLDRPPGLAGSSKAIAPGVTTLTHHDL